MVVEASPCLNGEAKNNFHGAFPLPKRTKWDNADLCRAMERGEQWARGWAKRTGLLNESLVVELLGGHDQG
jgi:hypothetical protein